jgi:hypothetical protein
MQSVYNKSKFHSVYLVMSADWLMGQLYATHISCRYHCGHEKEFASCPRRLPL